MRIAVRILVGLVAFIHVYIFVFECFLWEMRGPEIFTSFPKELFAETTALAFNQGVYNLFLALGLLWSFFIKDLAWQDNISLFFLGCVAIAGIAGSFTEQKIFFVQSLPALIGIALILVNTNRVNKSP